MSQNLAFERLMNGYHLEDVFRSSDSIYGMWPDLTMAYVNQGWNAFAKNNGGEPVIIERWSIGCRVLDSIAAPIRPFFEGNFGKVLEERRPWEHLYECSSKDICRKMKMTVYPLGRGEGLLAVHSLVQERSHSLPECDPLPHLYTDQNQLITQCCHCRRIQRIGADLVWDWVPAWTEQPPLNTSHGLCEPCFGYYYAEGRFLTNRRMKPFKM